MRLLGLVFALLLAGASGVGLGLLLAGECWCMAEVDETDAAGA